MRCRRARRVIIERELDVPLRDVVSRQLGLHLARCASCSERASTERLLIAELAALRPWAPRSIDATGDVMRRIESLGPIERFDAPSRGLGWATAAAFSVGLFLALTLIAALPRLPVLVRGGAASIGQAWTQAAPALLSLLCLPFRLLGPMLELASGLGSLLARLEPLAYAVALFGCMAMLATIATVVTRDLALGRPAVSRKEH